MATGPSRAAGPMFPECPQELICFSSLLSCFHHPSTSRGFEFAASVNIRGRGSSRAAVAGRRSLWSNPRIERAGVLPFFDRRANPITDDHRHVRYSRTSASSLIRAWPGLTVGSADVQNLVQRGDYTVDRAACFHVNHCVRRRRISTSLYIRHQKTQDSAFWCAKHTTAFG
jgi:hypothetical protein